MTSNRRLHELANGTERNDPEAPPQYPVGEMGTCGHPLSRYNPFRVCGPCRVRAALAETDYDPDVDKAPKGLPRKTRLTFDWERDPERVPVRRGSLLE